MIADLISNKKLNSIITELFIRGRKLNIPLVFITQSSFKVTKDDRLNSAYHFIMKIPNKREIHQIAINHSSDIDLRDLMRICKEYTVELYSFLVNDRTLSLDNPIRFGKNPFESICNKTMKTDDEIKEVKIQNDIKTGDAKISALSLGKTGKCEYPPGKKILPSNQKQLIHRLESLLKNKQKQLKAKESKMAML